MQPFSIRIDPHSLCVLSERLLWWWGQMKEKFGISSWTWFLNLTLWSACYSECWCMKHGGFKMTFFVVLLISYLSEELIVVMQISTGHVWGMTELAYYTVLWRGGLMIWRKQSYSQTREVLTTCFVKINSAIFQMSYCDSFSVSWCTKFHAAIQWDPSELLSTKMMMLLIYL